MRIARGRVYIYAAFVTATLWGKTSRPAPRVSTLVPFITMVFELYRYGLHYNVLLEMMMSVLQEVKRLTKKVYFIILPVGRPVSMQDFGLNVYTVFLF